MNKRLHIVCFDVPYPADHGGMFDLFYKIVALHKSGTEIILHSFEYGKGKQDELKKYCLRVHYYKRITGLKGFSFSLPYIVSSRINEELFKNLATDNLPILLEGTHTTYLAYKKLFPGRVILFRLHNIEQVYYHHLFKSEHNFFRKTYYWIETILLKKYEKKVLRNVSLVLPVSEKDTIKIIERQLSNKAEYLPVFLPFQEIKIAQGLGNYCLYHGNLTIAENAKAAKWLAKNVDVTKYTLIVAGKDPTDSLRRFLQKKNIRLITNPSNEKMFDLIQNAQINIVLSFNDTGIKLKLLNTLFHGKHCVANESGIPGPEFNNYCNKFSSSEELNKTISALIDKPFSEEEIESRKKFLVHHFSNEMNAKKLNALL